MKEGTEEACRNGDYNFKMMGPGKKLFCKTLGANGNKHGFKNIKA